MRVLSHDRDPPDALLDPAPTPIPAGRAPAAWCTPRARAVAAPLEIADPRAPDSRLAVRVGASVGIAVSAVAVDPESLLRQADAAMYQAKADGRGRWHLPGAGG